MLIYITGNIGSASDYEYFKNIEIKLMHDTRDRYVNVINISSKDDLDYKRQRIKNVTKADRIIFIDGYKESLDCLEEEHIAKYLNIPIEHYNDKS